MIRKKQYAKKIQNAKCKMIVAQQKFLSEIFAEHPKF
jgi:hypothetical protein